MRVRKPKRIRKPPDFGFRVSKRSVKNWHQPRIGSVCNTILSSWFGLCGRNVVSWTMNDFSLMDAIECGIVKLPRVPVADNIPGGEMPRFRNLWEHIRTEMPRKGRDKSGHLDPLSLPVALQTALEALYGHYCKTFELMQEAGIDVPPCFMWFATTLPPPSSSTIISPDSTVRTGLVPRRLRTDVLNCFEILTSPATGIHDPALVDRQ